MGGISPVVFALLLTFSYATHTSFLFLLSLRKQHHSHTTICETLQQQQYSGGHASDGQGGYYASFNRASGGEKGDIEDQRKNALAMAADVQKIGAVMKELDTLEGLLQRETDPTTGRSIELKSSIKKLMTNPEVLSALDRLELEGAPVWGLSSEERDMIMDARAKVNEC